MIAHEPRMNDVDHRRGRMAILWGLWMDRNVSSPDTEAAPVDTLNTTSLISSRRSREGGKRVKLLPRSTSRKADLSWESVVRRWMAWHLEIESDQRLPVLPTMYSIRLSQHAYVRNALKTPTATYV